MPVHDESDTYSILSFFSGAGFLDLGFEHSGFTVEFVNEWHKPFLRVYQHSRKLMGCETPHFGYSSDDVNTFLDDDSRIASHITALRKQNKLVGFAGGPPCPDFSVGGKNRGRNGDNGKLSQSYVSLITKNRPDYFLFENVKGLWRTARHREFFEELKDQLHQAGYATCERLTNALEFGAPQDRDRILLFGVHNSILREGFFKDDKLLDFDWGKNIVYNLEEIKAVVWPDTEPFCVDSNTPAPDEIAGFEPLTVEYWFRKNSVDSHPNANRFFTPRQGLQKMKTIDEGDVSKKSYKRLHRWRYSPTVAYGNNEVHLHPYKERRLSVAEALALQSLPKEYVLPNDMTLTDSFKTIGNGVPYLLAKGIAGSIHDYLIRAIDYEQITRRNERASR